ncbi:putative secreted protein [Pseudomonas aeruginosa]|nr:putative secreted protein [Pseudomonas aeruginosa]
MNPARHGPRRVFLGSRASAKVARLPAVARRIPSAPQGCPACKTSVSPFCSSATSGPWPAAVAVRSPCALLCLLLFPLAQLAFAINDAPMRPPLALAALGAGLAYLGGGSVFG